MISLYKRSIILKGYYSLESNDMSNGSYDLQVKINDLAELINLLRAQKFLSLSAEQKLDFFKQIDEASNKPLFLVLVAKSPEHIKVLLNDDSIVKHGRDFCLKLVQIDDHNKMGILELVSRKSSTDYLKETLESKVFKEILSPKDLYAVFSKANKFGVNYFDLLMDKSIEHFKVLLDSQALIKLKGSDIFLLLNSTDEVSGLNSFWMVILKGEEYWHLLFNSRILNKLNVIETSTLLSAQYAEDNNDIPLGYIIHHFSETELQRFLLSKAFKKLDTGEEYKQYIMQNDNGRTVVDIAMNKSIEAFRLLLECPRCFDILTNEQKVSILTATYTKMGLPIIYKTLILNNDYEYLILNSEVIVNMPQPEKAMLIKTALYRNLNVIENETDYTTPDAEIVDNPEKLEILINSAVFKSLDLDIQQQLLGHCVEDLKNN